MIFPVMPDAQHSVMPDAQHSVMPDAQRYAGSSCAGCAAQLCRMRNTAHTKACGAWTQGKLAFCSTFHYSTTAHSCLINTAFTRKVSLFTRKKVIIYSLCTSFGESRMVCGVYICVMATIAELVHFFSLHPSINMEHEVLQAASTVFQVIHKTRLGFEPGLHWCALYPTRPLTISLFFNRAL